MLARRSLALGRNAAAHQQPLLPAGARNMATLRELELRLKSVRNIEKITKVCVIVVVFQLHLLKKNILWNAVDENDCLHKARQGTACYAGW